MAPFARRSLHVVGSHDISSLRARGMQSLARSGSAFSREPIAHDTHRWDAIVGFVPDGMDRRSPSNACMLRWTRPRDTSDTTPLKKLPSNTLVRKKGSIVRPKMEGTF